MPREGGPSSRGCDFGAGPYLGALSGAGEAARAVSAQVQAGARGPTLRDLLERALADADEAVTDLEASTIDYRGVRAAVRAHVAINTLRRLTAAVLPPPTLPPEITECPPTPTQP